MAARNVELEVVKYNVDEMEHVAGRLLYNFAVHTDIVGTRDWMRARFELASIIREQRDQQLKLYAPGVVMEFSGFPNPIPVIRDEAVVFTAKEPQFTFRGTREYVSPQQRTYNQNATSAIVEEMSDVYHLIKKDYPPTLIFPRSEYGKLIEVFNAIMLT